MKGSGRNCAVSLSGRPVCDSGGHRLIASELGGEDAR